MNNLTLYVLSDWYRWSLVLFDFLFGNRILHGISSQSHTGSSESFIELSMNVTVPPEKAYLGSLPQGKGG